MVTRRRAAGVAALLVAGCASAISHRLTRGLPAELPDAATLAGWERFTGQASTDDGTVVYELYVNPVRPALYEITRYRMTTSAPDDKGRPRRHEETEKVLWNPAIGPREPLRAFEWIDKPSWKSLWLGDPGEWRRIDPSTPAYASEMRTAIRVYRLHNQGRD
jgi:hypothetical protein